MDHTILIDRFLRELDIRAVIEWNTFQPPYHESTGWPLRLPKVDWQQCDFLLLFFQDFVTMRDGVCVELQQVEQAYGDRADRVIVVHWPHALGRFYHGAVNLVEFDVHEYAILQNLERDVDSWRQVWNTQRDGGWQCLNGRRCAHRLHVVQHLQQHWQSGTVSYGDVITLDQWPYSTYRGTSNEDNWRRLLPIYARHDFNIVTETQYEQRPGIITEKTFFALLAAQIPIVIGYQGIVADCEAMGFDMFTDIVDVGYDLEPNATRWQSALDLNRDTVMSYRPTGATRDRLQQQAAWLLHEWPRQHFRQLLDQLERVFKARG